MRGPSCNNPSGPSYTCEEHRNLNFLPTSLILQHQILRHKIWKYLGSFTLSSVERLLAIIAPKEFYLLPRTSPIPTIYNMTIHSMIVSIKFQIFLYERSQGFVFSMIGSHVFYCMCEQYNQDREWGQTQVVGGFGTMIFFPNLKLFYPAQKLSNINLNLYWRVKNIQ